MYLCYIHMSYIVIKILFINIIFITTYDAKDVLFWYKKENVFPFSTYFNWGKMHE